MEIHNTRLRRQRKRSKMQLINLKRNSLILWRTGKLLRLGKDIIIEVSQSPYKILAISDVAWSPDNMHFASCSTDSTISIWHVNEHCKLTTFNINSCSTDFRMQSKWINI
jgi:WD40 repeat protein